MPANIISIPKKLNRLLNRTRKFSLIILFFMTILLSVIETVGISAVMPFISVVSNPDLIQSGRYKFFFDLSGFADINSFIVFFGIALIVFYFFRSVYNILYNYYLNKYAYGTYRYFAARLFKTYLAIPYKAYIQKNPSVLAQMINGEVHNLTALLLNCLQIFSEAFTVLLLYSLMVFVNWHMTLVLTVILILIVFIVFSTIIKASKKLGERRYAANVKLSKIVWQTLNNYKFIKLKGNQREIFDTFNESTSKLSRTTVVSNTLGGIPKLFLKTSAFHF